ncbi:oxidoreductase [Sphingomonas spermidinifaciens]|uniref:Oxidoreductase n=1 Tax=Sphingomonas spermidinifaciens TaxID=1141889 RepID=A0A2A4B7Q9_9SPHN|nr:SDR family oxidoreductase [Sphingomonas spermidinifaciens]PCD03955.1 oxidoreductase [Sphingomonas spermidinifaciens]
MKTSGNTILITGGGSGIGAALAHRFAARGDTVIIAGRRQAALDEVAAGHENLHALTLDIDDAAAIKAFAAEVVERFPALNVVMHNAGIMRFEALEGARDLSDAEATITTNLLGPIRLTDALIEHLKGQADAAIVTVTSGLAFVPLVAAPTYSATKAALHSYTVSLREALAGAVEVIEIAPPGVRTDLTPGQADRTGYLGLDDFADEVLALISRQPTPPEILVERVRDFRHAEADGKFAERFKGLNDFARAERKKADKAKADA